MIDDVRDYLAAVSAEFGVGLESCAWGSESPAWGYVALERQLGGRDVALLWDENEGWSLATETLDSCDLVTVARMRDDAGGEVAPPPETVATFVARLPVWQGAGELLASGLEREVRVPATQGRT